MEQGKRRTRIGNINAIHPSDNIAVLKSRPIDQALRFDSKVTKAVDRSVIRCIRNGAYLGEQAASILHCVFDLVSVNLIGVLRDLLNATGLGLPHFQTR